jgi:outer membrane immunogenic protein
MKRILLTTVSLGVLGLLSPALAADFPTTYTKAPVSSVYDWTGFYVGGFGGGGYGVNYSSQGELAGGEAGYNVQSGRYVFGVEGDWFWSNIKGDDAFALGSNDATNLRWGGTLRARSGFTVDRLLMFFTGGWAYGDLLHTNTDPVNGVDQFTNHRNGLTGGGGIAYALTDNLIGKLEYRYYDFNQYSRAGTPLTPNGQLPYTVDSSYSVITLGLDYKFGGGAVARY